MISLKELNKIDNCKALLLEPGPEVVGKLVAEIRRLNERESEARSLIATATEEGPKWQADADRWCHEGSTKGQS